MTKAPWTTAFPAQAKRLRPENSPEGGLKARSTPESVRMSIYVPIANLFKEANPKCSRCFINPTADVHHLNGRLGLLLFDIRHWLPVCRPCHTFLENNPGNKD